MARRFVGEQLPKADSERRENALLVTSELVTNAYRHGSGTIELRVKPSDGHLLIDVLDQGNPADVAMRPGTGELGGWGLRIVDELSTEWGVQGRHTHVWAKLPLS
ncbi:MAG TPA: ATP-binding protein [Solirubrobacteraceae bacterium]|jgi:anti-sigma regulatory factor (Ser/Thr protein kinase)